MHNAQSKQELLLFRLPPTTSVTQLFANVTLNATSKKDMKRKNAPSPGWILPLALPLSDIKTITTDYLQFKLVR